MQVDTRCFGARIPYLVYSEKENMHVSTISALIGAQVTSAREPLSYCTSIQIGLQASCRLYVRFRIFPF